MIWVKRLLLFLYWTLMALFFVFDLINAALLYWSDDLLWIFFILMTFILAAAMTISWYSFWDIERSERKLKRLEGEFQKTISDFYWHRRN
jgi:predicted membrane protein